jgi:primosomal protein N''
VSAAVPEPDPTVPASGATITTLRVAYPLEDAEISLRRLRADLATEKAEGRTSETFAKRLFGHKNGQQLSRHIKRLKKSLEADAGVAC